MAGDSEAPKAWSLGARPGQPVAGLSNELPAPGQCQQGLGLWGKLGAGQVPTGRWGLREATSKVPPEFTAPDPMPPPRPLLCWSPKPLSSRAICTVRPESRVHTTRLSAHPSPAGPPFPLHRGATGSEGCRALSQEVGAGPGPGAPPPPRQFPGRAGLGRAVRAPSLGPRPCAGAWTLLMRNAHVKSPQPSGSG